MCFVNADAGQGGLTVTKPHKVPTMQDMTKSLRWKRRTPSQAEELVNGAFEGAPVVLDVERLQKSLQSPRFVMPSGLTPEQKRQFMLAVADGHR